MTEPGHETSTGTSMLPAREHLEIRRAGEKDVSVVTLECSELIIGREGHCTLCLADPMVSRRHARFYRDPFGRWWLRDLDSRNGTRVNGADVSERVIGLNDVIEIGPFVLRMRRTSAADESTVTMDAVPVPVVEEDVRTTTLAEAGTPRVDASHLSMLMKFCQDLLAMEDPRQRLGALCRLMVGDEFHGRTALVMRVLRDRPEVPPQMLCEPEYARDVRREPPYISRGVLSRLRRSAEPVLAGNAAPGAVDVQLTIHSDVLAASAVACPLHVDEHAVDVLYVMLPPEYGTGEWLTLVSLAAEHFQQAEFGWTSRRQAQEHAVIEGELEQARQIQEKLIPRERPIEGLDVAIRFKPCRWVGGDYVDLMSMTGGRTLLTVADVCGKGLQAALVAASVHSLVHATVGAGLGLADVMQGINRHLCEYLPAHSFATMVAVVFDPATGEMEMINAGHPPALIVESTGGARWLQSCANPPLGVMDVSFELQHEHMDAGEMLAMFSDGLIEGGGATDEDVGLEPLARQLRSVYAEHRDGPAGRVADCFNALLADVQGDRLHADDCAFLLARRT